MDAAEYTVEITAVYSLLLTDDFPMSDSLEKGLFAVTPLEMEVLTGDNAVVSFQENPDDHTLGGVKQFLSNKQKRRTRARLC